MKTVTRHVIPYEDEVFGYESRAEIPAQLPRLDVTVQAVVSWCIEESLDVRLATLSYMTRTTAEKEGISSYA